MKIRVYLFIFVFLSAQNLYCLEDSAVKDSRKEHIVYFENTDYELHVYKIYGEKKSNTLMIIGGIQGDEPGGFLTADSYADISLEKGSLIVVPRANLPSILVQKRSINVDMNRKFADEDARLYEGKIVKILKELISQSDCLLNLHEGSGFFNPEWIDDMKNPMRYGQSIIADFESVSLENGEKISLMNMAERVVGKINEKIDDINLHFRFNNHRTSEKDSRHKEQRKSATYFAVTKCSIPAFGIEASKSLPLFQKVKHHQYAINAFFDEFGIIPELPALTLEKPELRYLVLSINGNTPIVLNKEETVYVKKGSMIKIVHAEANYSRGITVDVVDCGGKNDIGNEITIEKNTRIAAKKDYEPCGSVYVKVTDNKSDDYFSVAEKKIRENHFYFQVRINGNRLVNIKNNGVLKVSAGDFIELIDVDSGMHDPGLLEVNIKGYVNDSMNNTGEDRGCVVDTSTDFWEKYSTKGNGLNYPVVASYNGYPVASMIIRLEGETEKILILESQKGDLFCVSNKNDFHVDKADFFIDSVSGVFQSDLDSGFYYLEANGKKIADLKSKPALSNFYVSGDKKIAISLFAELKGKKRKKCDFIIKIKEK
ncbi:MAG: hypothetical protein H6680_01480 [Desulfobacteraceae bacterium]|nr:hypothetical protein [Desulfobacteraceae bacterium]